MLKEIKKQFMAYRNGIISETLRQALTRQGNNPYHIIFGLNLPQLSEIAHNIEDKTLWKPLWADKTVRESRLLACYLLTSNITEDEAIQLVTELQTTEEADILCMKVLCNIENKNSLVNRLQKIENDADNEYNANITKRCISRLIN